MLTNTRRPLRQLRQRRVRRKVRGTDGRPRLCVFRSSRHIYAQLIADEGGRTLLSVSTLSKEVRDSLGGQTGNREAARRVGELIAKKALDAGISEVVFDRNGFLYHGRIQTLADAAREAGLKL